MAVEDRSSFVNENFDELESEDSKDSLEQKKLERSDEVKYDLPTVTIKDPEEVPVLELNDVLKAPTPPGDIKSDETDDDGYSAVIRPDTKGIAIIAPSQATATLDTQNGGESGSSDVDETNHRSLPHTPPLFHHYDVIQPNVLQHDDQNMFDLQVSIVSHEKHVISKTESFMMYKINTKSLRPRHLFEKPEYVVWRRYKDFEWLYNQLEKNYPTLILPPLPGKQISRYFDHMNEAFVEERQKCLDQFLWRLGVHPFFSYDHNFKMFLTAESSDFSSHVTESTSGDNFLGKVSSSVKQVSTSMRLKHPDPYFIPHGKYFHNFSEKLGVLERIETRLQNERAGLASSNEDLSSIVYSWANSESQLGSTIRKFAGVFEANASALVGLNETNSTSFQLALKMYQLYSNSGVSAIKRRDALQLEYEIACEERDKKKKAHEEAVVAGKTDKIVKLAQEVEKCGVTAEHTQDQLTKSNEQLRVDIEKWMESKDTYLQEIFTNWTDNYLHYHERMFHEWEELLLLLRQLGQDSSPPPQTTPPSSIINNISNPNYDSISD